MKRTAPPTQLNLHLSLTESVTLQERLARCEAWANDVAADNAKLTAQIERLKKENRSWERSYKRLKEERNQIYQARLNDAHHPLRTECKRLQDQVDNLRNTLRQWGQRSVETGPGCVDKGALTKLLTIAHPDRWSYPEASALRLAHEMTVQLNHLRARLEEQP